MSQPGLLTIRTPHQVAAQAQMLVGDRSRVAAAAVDDETTEAPPAGSVGELWLYGLVGGWWRGFDAESVSNALRTMDDDVIYVRIHSPGGHAADGIAIANLLRNHTAKIIVVVDGLAASAASVIAIAGDEIVMCPGSQLMLHDASTGGWGNADELRAAAEWIDGQSANYAGVYAYRAGGTAEQWRQVMLANNGRGTWYTAEAAVSAGLADSVGTRPAAGSPPVAPEDEIDEDDDEMVARIAHDLALLEQTVHPAARAAWQGERPAAAGASRSGTPKPPVASAPGSNRTEGAALVDLTDEQIATLREQVGFPETADAETIVAAITEALAERAEDAGTSTTSAATTATAPEGFTLVPTVAWETAQSNAQLGAQAAERLRTQDREAFLDAHRDRFPPAARAAWQQQYDRAPAETRAYLESAPVIVPIEELGHDATSAEASASDDGWFPGYPAPAVKGA
ncbi:MAG TPA: head maturation protease, ClpP-related [Nocardioides sp.]|uniref:head maturation protease, ClpP-related n=1 Tax=Nocardioides sp. TaxID=35761 RepID=UPI002CBC358A|nr:head maturation protease, ClpP-related [Nocardioides sp.]HTW17073.1 head maturation protease, ClpP-related [Nocardioides sp.]